MASLALTACSQAIGSASKASRNPTKTTETYGSGTYNQNRDTAAYNFWSDTIGWRARVFHLQIAYSNAIYHAIAAHYAALAPSLNQATLTPSAPNHPDPSCVPAPSATPPPAGDICGDWYKIPFDHFEIYGKNFNPEKVGTNGSELKKQIKGCGDLTNLCLG